MFDVNFHPANRQLRQFGTICVVALPLAAWIWTHNAVISGWAGATGLILCGIGWVAPKVLKPVFVGLMIVTLPIGLVVGEVAMLVLYFGMFLPMSIVFRIIGRDTLGRRSPSPEETFWRERKRPKSAASYYRQF